MTQAPRRGRKPVQMDLSELEKLCGLHCTHEEIAGWFGVSTRTIESRRKHPEFAQAMQRGRAKGCISLRRQQMKMLEGGSASMGVWLGKQILGQREIVTTQHTGLAGGPIRLAAPPDLTGLTELEIQQLRELVRKLQPSIAQPRDEDAATVTPARVPQ